MGFDLSSVIATVLREVAGKLIRSIPDYIIKAMTGLLRWYFGLGMIGMIMATCGVAIAVIVFGPIFGVPSHAQNDIRGFLEPVLVLLFLAAIFLGLIRGGGGSS
jgi:hypothetical protein